MKRKTLNLFIFITLFTSMALLFSFANNYTDIARNLDIFGSTFKEVNTHYVDEIDPNEFFKTGINGMLSALDPYSTYYDGSESMLYNPFGKEKYSGIGIQMSLINDKWRVTQVLSNSPAHSAGIKVGDEIESIDQVSSNQFNVKILGEILPGPNGTSVNLKIKRLNQSGINIKCERSPISNHNLSYFKLPNNSFGLIKIPEINQGISTEVSRALNSLQNNDIGGLILDLRNNPGGVLTEAVNILSLFLPKGSLVISTDGKPELSTQKYHTLNTPKSTDLPIVVLINENSASAAEIIAGSLQDYDRAVVIGTPSRGKGTIQEPVNLKYDAVLNITTSNYKLPSGRSISKENLNSSYDAVISEKIITTNQSFVSKNNRPLEANNGIIPDILINQDSQKSELLNELIIDGHLLDYSLEWVYNNATESKTEINFNHFIEWISKRELKYFNELKKQTTELTKAITQQQFSPSVKTEAKNLHNALSQSFKKLLLYHKDEISTQISSTIYNIRLPYPENIKMSCHLDTIINSAVEILNTNTRYKELLQTP